MFPSKSRLLYGARSVAVLSPPNECMRLPKQLSFLSSFTLPIPKFLSKLKHDKESSPSPRRQLFRHVPPGSGGTYDLCLPSVPHIGTDGCLSCVGVYFAVDDARCFAAHIWTWVEPSGSSTGGLRITDQATYDRLKQEVQRRLDAESLRSSWGPKSELMRDSVVMVSKQQALEAVKVWDTVVSKCVADAVNEWLGVLPGRARKPELCGGFVVHHPGHVEEHCDNVVNDTRWRALKEPSNMCWRFGV